MAQVCGAANLRSNTSILEALLTVSNADSELHQVHNAITTIVYIDYFHRVRYQSRDDLLERDFKMNNHSKITLNRYTIDVSDGIVVI